ncbi:cysteine hydrolase family protein [Natronomonas sp. EA1]|uniref:cysteine hydrolase family protein n=1 Tax=Natronomonas sp. EA1 TaxID=3421655 RepID=UPI003EBDE73B
MTTGLVLIDVQTGFDDPAWGTRNNPDAEAAIAALLAGFRAAGAPVFHVRHASTEEGSPLRPDGPGFAFKPEGEPEAGEPTFEKSVNSGFIGTGLEDALRNAGVERVVVCGFTTDHCVSTTTRMAENLGFEVAIVRDATATFGRELDGEAIDAETNHRVALAQLQGEFAEVVTVADVLAGFR